MSFAYKTWLLGLIAAPALALAIGWWYRKDVRRRAAFGEPGLVVRLNPGGHKRAATRTALLGLALLLLVVTAARPRAGHEWLEAEGAGIDVCIAIDVSNSMRAPDVSFGSSRLALAIRICQRLSPALEFDRVGLVTFSDRATTICPLTCDMGAVLTMLDGVDYETVGEGGTSLAEAILESCRRFDPKEERGRVVIILSDGEDHERGLESAIEKARELTVAVHTVGLGTLEGSPIPDGSSFFPRKKTYRGKTVISRLEEEVLKRIAKETRGVYMRASSLAVADELAQVIRSAANKGTVVKTMAASREVFQIPLALAILVLTFEMLMPVKRVHTGLKRLGFERLERSSL